MKRVLTLLITPAMAGVLLFVLYAPLNAQTPTPEPTPEPDSGYFLHPVDVLETTWCDGDCQVQEGGTILWTVDPATSAFDPNIQLHLDAITNTLGEDFQWCIGNATNTCPQNYRENNIPVVVGYRAHIIDMTDGVNDQRKLNMAFPTEGIGRVSGTNCSSCGSMAFSWEVWHGSGGERDICVIHASYNESTYLDSAGVACDWPVTGLGWTGQPDLGDYADGSYLFNNAIRVETTTSFSILVRFELIAYGVAPEEDSNEDPHPAGFPFPGSCAFVITNTCESTTNPETGLTQTLAISNTSGITATCDITHTDGLTESKPLTSSLVISSNLLLNGGFESRDDDGNLAHWQSLPEHDVIARVEGVARSGSYALHDRAQIDVYQDLGLYESGRYMAGFYVDDPGPAFYWTGVEVIDTHQMVITDGYQLVTGTRETGGGSSWVNFSLIGSNAHVDDAFLIPVDESDQLRCDPAAYGVEITDTVNLADPDPLPPYGDGNPYNPVGSTCYDCNEPQDSSAGAVSLWIAWLACIIRNLFMCSLRVWLLEVGNWVAGSVMFLQAFFWWWPETIQDGANWFADQVVPGIAMNVSIVTNPGTNFIDLLIAVLGLIQSIMGNLSALLLGVIELLIGVVDALRLAFAAEPVEFVLNGTSEPSTGGAGPSDGKIIYIFFLLMSVVDSAVISRIGLFVPIVLGAMALLVLIWTINFWRDFVQF